MNYLRTVTAVLALGMFVPVLVFGQSESNDGADPEPGWEMPRLTDGPARSAGLLDDADLHPDGASRVFGRQGVLQRGGVG